MGLFSREKKINADIERFEKALRTIAELQQVQRDQASAFRNLETEWLNTHDKFKPIMGRLQKRDAT